MKKARFKKGISNLLAATMVATMVAPALPVYAAGGINLDIESLFPGVFDAAEKATLHLTGAPGASTPTLPVQTDGSGRELLPFLQVDGSGSGSGYKLHDYNGMLAAKDISLSDYSINGWYVGDQSGLSPRYFYPSYFPAVDTVYTARGTGSGNQYIVKTQLTLPSGTSIYMGDLSPAYADVHPGSAFSKTASRIDGFEASSGTISMYKVADADKSPTRTSVVTPPATVPFSTTADPSAFSHAFAWNATDKKVSGRMVPRDVAIDFTYTADTNKKQPIVEIGRASCRERV